MNTLMNSSQVFDKIMFRVYSSDNHSEDDLFQVADSLKEVIQHKCKDYVSEVNYQVDASQYFKVAELISQNFPLFFSDNYSYNLLKKKLDKKVSPQEMELGLNGYLKQMALPSGFVVRPILLNDPLGLSLPFLSKLKGLQKGSGFKIYNGALYSADLKSTFILIKPLNGVNETGKNQYLVDVLKGITSSFNHKQIKVQYFGSTPIAVGNSKQIQRDTYLTISVAAVLLLLLVIFTFGKKRIPLLVLLNISFAALFALAVISFFKSSISVIAIGAGAVVLGVAINYPIHFFSHLQDNRNIAKTIKDMFTPMTIGSLTTIGGFLCLLFVKSKLLNDLGLFGALSLIGASIFCLIYLPPLSTKLEGNFEEKPHRFNRFIYKICRFEMEKKKYLLIPVILLTPILLYFSSDIKFENDMHALNYLTPEMKKAEKDFNELTFNKKNTIYVLSEGKNLDEALENAFALRTKIRSLNNDSIHLNGIVEFLPSAKEREKLNDFWKAYWTEDKKAHFTKDVKDLCNKRSIDFSLYKNTIDKISNGGEIDSAQFNQMVFMLGKEFITQKEGNTLIASQVYIGDQNKDNIVKQLKPIDGNQILEWKSITDNLIAMVNDDFQFITYFTMILVFVVLLLTYGRLELALIAFIPMIVSWIWILGIMAVFDIKFNLINVILSTFIFGIGDDYCIFTLDSKIKEYSRNERSLPVVRKGILISGITTLVGMGVMIFAEHPALKSLGLVSIIGVASVIFISQTLEPYLFNLLTSLNKERVREPLTIGVLLQSVFCFGFFLIGSIVLGILGVFIVLNPFSRRKGRKIFRYLIHKFTRLIFRLSFLLKRKIVNPNQENFRKPAIVIANHQSMVDILLMLALNPRIVMLVKPWVWNSVVLGPIVRLAGFQCADDNLQINEKKLQDLMSEGFSLLIFPEGSRSDGKKLKRFHKGSFYLAQKHKLDIVPILIDNTAYVLPKKSCKLLPGYVGIKILDRISSSDLSYGATYQERCKNISAYFKKEMDIFQSQLHTPQFYKSRLIAAFLHKGPVLEWYMRVKLHMENYYTSFDKIIPKEGKIVDLGCGYGFLGYMLKYLKPKREILGMDYDGDKVRIANENLLKPEGVEFRYADLKNTELPAADCFIFSDVLHYLPAKDRESILFNAYQNLYAGGSIIIRDSDTSEKQEHHNTEKTEYFSTRFFRFNKADNPLDFFSMKSILHLGEKWGLKASVMENDKFFSSKVVILTKNKDIK
ncbi:MAG: MMPL family transporter [Bacteroidales bacterium]